MTTVIEHAIDIDHGAHKATVTARQHPCGLLTYEIPDHVEVDTAYVWRVGHHSGYCVAAARTEHGAIQAVDILADLTDWNADVSTVEAALPGGPPREIWQRLGDIGVVHPRYR